MNSISGVQRWHTNQYSLPLGLSLLHLKLRPCGRQTAQHISWSQGRSTSPLISKSILWTSTPVWTAPDTMHRPTLISILCPYVYYLSAIHLPQGQHAVYMCSDIILFNLCHTCMHHMYTIRNLCPLTSS